MSSKMDFVQSIKPAERSETIIKLTENLEFTLKRKTWTHIIKNVKGDFEITKITETFDNKTYEIKYNKSSNEFFTISLTPELTLYITANVQNVVKMKEKSAVKYQLQISSTSLQSLKLNGFFQAEFVLPGFDDLKFAYYVKKIGESSEKNDIEIQIKNPYSVEIQGKKGDFKCEQNSIKGIDLPLLFCFDKDSWVKPFDPSNPNFSLQKDNQIYARKQSANTDQISLPEKSSFTESYESTFAVIKRMNAFFEDDETPDDVESTKLLKPKNVKRFSKSVNPSMISSSDSFASKISKIRQNLRYPDVYFITSEKTKIPSHRWILAAFSDIFMQIFDETFEIPVNIIVEDFDAETIQSALNFLHEIPKIDGKEMEVFKFAVKFGIQSLIDYCCSFFEESVSPSNVCEYIQIAYLHNFQELKEKCLQILVQKKEGIDPEKITELPKNVIIDAFLFKL